MPPPCSFFGQAELQAKADQIQGVTETVTSYAEAAKRMKGLQSAATQAAREALYFRTETGRATTALVKMTDEAQEIVKKKASVPAAITPEDIKAYEARQEDAAKGKQMAETIASSMKDVGTLRGLVSE